jgi:inositol monophosphatase 3
MVKNKVVLVLVILAVSFFFVYFIGKFSTEKADHTLKISEVLSASIYLAEKAGRIVHDFRLNDKNVNLQIEHKQGYKGNKELVTEADKRSNEVIINGLSLLWPSLQLRSEERSIKEKQTLSHADVPPLVNAQLKDVTKNDDIVNLKDVTIWIDPLDATKEYAEVKPELLKYVTVMVCVAVKEKAVASVIYQPFVKGI